MTASALRRLAAMQPGELRFRLTCEARKAAGRLRAAASTPHWDRRRLEHLLNRSGLSSEPWQAAIGALHRGDYHAAHVHLGLHFAQRSTPFPMAAREVRGLADAVATDFPGAAGQAADRAGRLLDGRYDLLGYRDLRLGPSPDWHADAVHDRRSPRVYWSAVPYLDPDLGDHKVIWELNRHQHWLHLGRAYALSGDRRYYEAFTAQVTGWIAANPPLLGTNWVSMLELAFRALSWLWAVEFFAASAGAGDREPWLPDLLLAIDRQLTHVEHNLSHYFSPNTHLSGEALALYVAGLSLPELRASARRTATGRDVLVNEASRQIRPDGGHAELSAHYHRYSTDFYLLAAAVARRAGDPAAAVFDDAARSQARFLRTIADDRGVIPQIGDDDGGQLFPICGRPPDDCGDTLATAAVLLGEPALAIGRAPEETYWICGVAARGALTDARARWTSAALTASGYFVSRTPRGDHLVFDAGPHGFLNGGHAHADALSCTVIVEGRPLMIDPGTATYTMDPEVRDRFRSTPMHNTIVLDGRPQSTPRGAFHWRAAASAHAGIWRATSDCDYVEGTHDGYLPRRHTRGILAIHGLGWWIVDHVLGTGPAEITGHWHLDPQWTCSLVSTHVCRVQREGAVLAVASSRELSLLLPGTDRLAVRSPAYGAIEPAPVLRTSLSTPLPASVATFIPAAAELAEDLALEPVPLALTPAGEWHGCAFRARWRGGAMTLLASVEQSGYPSRDTAAPVERWGTAELQTDARLAVVLDRVAGASEAVLVNGAQVTASPSHRLVSLNRRVPLLRLTTTSVAPSMHEVGMAVE